MHSNALYDAEIERVLRGIMPDSGLRVGPWGNQPVAHEHKLRRVSPGELYRLLEQAQAERWSKLALVGPGLQLGSRTQAWPESLRAADRVFQLIGFDIGLAGRLRSLTGLTSLILAGK